jgi:hypothetical protein
MLFCLIYDLFQYSKIRLAEPKLGYNGIALREVAVYGTGNSRRGRTNL